MPPKKIIFFYLKAGGGHESTAKFLSNQIQSQYPESQIKLIDIAYKNSQSQQTLVLKGYNWLLEEGKWLWWLLNLTTKNYIGARLFLWLPELLITHTKIAQTIKEEILEFQPDLIISTYYFVAEVGSKVNFEARKPRIITIVSDIFGAHPIWFTSKACEYTVFSDEVYKQCKKYVPNDHIHKFNLLFNSKFENQLTFDKKCNAFKNLDLDQSIKTILILSGGNGLPNGDKILEELLTQMQTQDLEYQIIFVTGRNQELYQKCQNILARFKSLSSKVKLFGFRDDIYTLMNLANIIVTKAGPATILEAAALQKPILISHYILEQETANNDWVINNKLGIYEPRPRIVAEKAINFLNGNFEFEKVELHSSVKEVVEWLMKGCID